jgi:ribosomal protein L29
MATKKQTIAGKTPAELNTLLAKQREELRTLRFASAGGRPKDSAAPKKTRKQIARILTELHAQKTGAMLGTGANA